MLYTMVHIVKNRYISDSQKHTYNDSYIIGDIELDRYVYHRLVDILHIYVDSQIGILQIHMYFMKIDSQKYTILYR